MSITTEQRQDLLTTIVGMFDGAPTREILESLIARVEAGDTVAQLADELGNTAEFGSIFPTWLTAEEFAETFVDRLLGDNVDAATTALAEDFVAGLINGGSSLGQAAYTAISTLATVPEDDATWGAAVAQLNNKVKVATEFAKSFDFDAYSALSLKQLQSVTEGVTSDAQTVEDKLVLIGAGVLDEDSQVHRVTDDQDIYDGLSINDLFEARLGQVTSQTVIDGNGGKDTLTADVDSTQAVNPELNSVEVVKFQAQLAVGATTSDNEIPTDTVFGDANTDAQIDAQDMHDTVEFWSVDSRADLVIEDVRNKSHETRLVMKDTDPGDVDYAVYFQDLRITAPESEVETSLYLEVLDLEAAAAQTGPLTNNPYKGVQIKIGDQVVQLAADEAINAASLGREPTYQDIVNALNSALQAQGFTSITASLGETFSKFNSDDGQLYQGTTIVLTNDGSEVLSGEGWLVDGVLPPGSNVHTNIANQAPNETSFLTQVDVDLDNVGWGSESGDFRAGNMSTGDSGSKGIQQFNVTVHDSSWITSMSTTNDDLEEVYVVNSDEMLDEGTNGDLRIGDNGDDDGYTGLQNVRVFDASAMTGNVTLEADLYDAVISKYDNLVDSQTGVENDNIQFNYTTGSGDDVVALTVSEEAVSYEDFELTVQTGTGSDEVVFEVDGTAANNLDANWNTDQEDLDNVVISTGAGNDTVRAVGDGEVTITTAGGDDVVYSDNSGLTNADNNVATWVFNANNIDVSDIDGSGVSSKFFLLNGKVTVAFSAGNESDGSANLTSGTADADNVADPYTNGFEATFDIAADDYVSDNTDINQALKNAINSDSVLSKWLLAEDGPDNSVIVTAKVDGVFTADDLDVNITQDSFVSAFPGGTASATVQTAYENFTGNSALTYDAAANTAQLTAAQGSGTGYNSNSVLGETAGNATAVAVTVTETVQGVAAVGEVQSLDLSAVTVANTESLTFTIDGVAVVYTNGTAGSLTGAALAADIAATVGTTGPLAGGVANGATYAFAQDGTTATQLNITQATVTDDIADITTVNTTALNGQPTGSEDTKGVAPVAEVQTFDFSGITLAVGETINITLDGETQSYTNNTASALSDAALETAVGAVVDFTNYTENDASGVAGDFSVTQTAGNESDVALATATISEEITLTGVASDEEANDNTINVGEGNDVVALSTQGDSNETLVFTNYAQGEVSVLNFTAGTDAGQDVLDFSAYLDTMGSTSGSTESQFDYATNFVSATGIAANDVAVISFNDTSGVASETFANLNATNLLAAINGTADYGSLVDGSASAGGQVGVGGANQLVEDTRDHVLLVENFDNEGEYKVFHLTSSDAVQTGATNGDFASATLIGTVDLGASGTNFVDANFAG